jgi:hypothetical protein
MLIRVGCHRPGSVPHGLDRGLNQSHRRATEASWTELRFTKRPGRNLVGGMQGTRNEQVVGSIPIGGSEAGLRQDRRTCRLVT